MWRRNAKKEYKIREELQSLILAFTFRTTDFSDYFPPLLCGLKPFNVLYLGPLELNTNLVFFFYAISKHRY